MAVRPQPRLFTVEEYYRMGESGILDEDDRVELIHGEIIQMTPIGIAHASCVNRLNMLLTRLLSPRAIVQVQNPVGIDQRSEPQPDLILLAPRSDYYRERRPGPRDTLLVIEVADSSLQFDRTVKAPLYAAAGIQELWIVDLAHRRVEVLRSPGPTGYAETQVIGAGDGLALLAFPDVVVTLEDIVGP